MFQEGETKIFKNKNVLPRVFFTNEVVQLQSRNQELEMLLDKDFDIKNINIIARVLGCPDMKKSGIFLNRKIGEPIGKGDPICTFYSENVYNLKEAKESLKNFPFINFK